MKELEDIDRNLLKCPCTTPKEACHLELRILTIGSIVKSRRLNYLHYLLQCEKEGMLYKFFQAMHENPSKDDWSEQVLRDLEDLNIKDKFEDIQSKSQFAMKKMVKIKIQEYALDQLNMQKFSHSKMDGLVHIELKMQEYLLSEEITTDQKRNLFSFRTRMAEFSENYPSGNDVLPCKMCDLHRDCQAHSVSCHETMKHVRVKGKYEEIFANNVSRDSALMLNQITEIRKNKLG